MQPLASMPSRSSPLAVDSSNRTVGRPVTLIRTSVRGNMAKSASSSVIAHLFTDGAIYEPDGTLTMIGPKVRAVRHLSTPWRCGALIWRSHRSWRRSARQHPAAKFGGGGMRVQPKVKLPLLGFFHMDTVGMALVVGGMAFLFSGLIFLIPIRGSSSPPDEPFEDSQERIEQYLREIHRHRRKIDS